MALWKNKKMRMGDLEAELFKQDLEGADESIGFKGPAITATPPPPASKVENGVAIIEEILKVVADSDFQKP